MLVSLAEIFLSLLFISWGMLQFKPHNLKSQSIRLGTRAKLQCIFRGWKATRSGGCTVDPRLEEIPSLTPESLAYHTMLVTLWGLERVPTSVPLCNIGKHQCFLIESERHVAVKSADPEARWCELESTALLIWTMWITTVLPHRTLERMICVDSCKALKSVAPASQ